MSLALDAFRQSSDTEDSIARLTADDIICLSASSRIQKAGIIADVPLNTVVAGVGANRAASTAIYFLLRSGEVSRWGTGWMRPRCALVTPVRCRCWHRGERAAARGSARSRLATGEQPQAIAPAHAEQAKSSVPGGCRVHGGAWLRLRRVSSCSREAGAGCQKGRCLSYGALPTAAAGRATHGRTWKHTLKVERAPACVVHQRHCRFAMRWKELMWGSGGNRNEAGAVNKPAERGVRHYDNIIPVAEEKKL